MPTDPQQLEEEGEEAVEEDAAVEEWRDWEWRAGAVGAGSSLRTPRTMQ
jgi:hypothetical protein